MATELQQFADTVHNALGVIGHVWEQIHALKLLIDERLPGELEKIGIGCMSPGPNDYWNLDLSGEVCIAWMWRYDLTQFGNGKGRRPRLGYLYILVRIAPDLPADSDAFEPYLAVFVDHQKAKPYRSGEATIMGEYTDIDKWEGSGCKPVNISASPNCVLRIAEYYDSEDLENCGAAMFIRMASIDSGNLGATVIDPTVQLVEHCRETWSHSRDEDLGRVDERS